MMDISIIGGGKLGTNLGFALVKKGFSIKGVSCRSLSSAEESVNFIGQGVPIASNVECASLGNLIFICVPDREIEKLGNELSSGGLNWKGKYVFHCSGLLTSDALSSLKEKNAYVASFHPIQSFSQKKPVENKFKGIYFGLEGDEEALNLAKKIVEKLEAKYLRISKENKALYHTACTIASNFFVVLLDIATELLKETDISKELAFNSLFPLVKGTMENIEKFGIKEALTGPLIRGDLETIHAHIKALEDKPEELKIYHQFSLKILKSFKIKGIKKFNSLESLFMKGEE